MSLIKGIMKIMMLFTSGTKEMNIVARLYRKKRTQKPNANDDNYNNNYRVCFDLGELLN